MTWLTTDFTLIMMVSILLCICTRIAELSNSPILTIFILIANVTATIVVLIMNPFIHRSNNVLFVSFCTAASIISFLNVLCYYGVWVSGTIRVMVLFITPFVFYIVFSIIIKKLDENAICLINSLSDQPFTDVFRGPYHFLRCARSAFWNAETVILSWKPFEEAIVTWPDNTAVWIQYLRFLAVFSEMTDRMLSTLKKLKQQRIYTLRLKFMHQSFKKLGVLRKRQILTMLAQQFAIIDQWIDQAKSALVGYWTGMVEGSSSVAYEMGTDALTLMETIQSELLRLVSTFPNNSHICLKFAQYLNDIAHDPIEASIWLARGAQPNSGGDIAQQMALQLFVSLPHRLFGSTPSNNEISINQNDTSVLVTESEANITDEGESMSNKQAFVSNIRTYAEQTPIIFISHFIVLYCIISSVLVVLGIMFPGILYCTQLDSIKSRYNGAIASSNIAKLTMMIKYDLYRHVLSECGILPTDQKVMDILESKVTEDLRPVNSNLHDNIYLLRDSIEILQHIIGYKIASRYDVSNHFYLVDVDYKSANFESDGSLVYSEYNVKLNEAILRMEILVAHFTPVAHTLSEEWIQQVIANTNMISSNMMQLAVEFCLDCNHIIDSFSSISTAVALIFLIVTIGVLIIFILQLREISKKWISIVGIIHSIPRVSIQKTIMNYTQYKKETKEEQKYSQFFNLINTGKDSRSIPIFEIALFACLQGCYLVACIFVGPLIMEQSKTELKTLHYRMCLASAVVTAGYDANALILERVAIDNGLAPWVSDKILADEFAEKLAAYQDVYFQFRITEFEGMDAGIFSAPTSINRAVTRHELGWINAKGMHDSVHGISPISLGDISLELFRSVAAVVISGISENTFSGTDPVHILCQHMWECHTTSILFSRLDNIYYDAFEHDISTNTVFRMILLLALVLVGVITIFLLSRMIMKMQKVIRFTLVSLAMLDPRDVTNSANVMAMFEGKFEGMLAAPHSTYQKYLDIIDEAVFMINSERQLVSTNHAANSLSGEAASMNLPDISVVLNFANKAILESISHPVGKDETFRTNLKTNAHPIGLEVLVILKKGVTFGKEAFTILIVNQVDEYLRTLDELNTLKSSTKNYLLREFPKPMWPLFQNTMKLSLGNVFILVATILNNDPANPKQIEAINKIVDSMCGEQNDAIRISNTGKTFTVMFNSRKQGEEAPRMVKQIMHFSTSLCHALKDAENIITSYGCMNSRNATFGVLIEEDRHHFDSYVEEIWDTIILSSKSKPGCIILSPLLADLLPDVNLLTLPNIVINGIDGITIYAKEICICRNAE